MISLGCVRQCGLLAVLYVAGAACWGPLHASLARDSIQSLAGVFLLTHLWASAAGWWAAASLQQPQGPAQGGRVWLSLRRLHLHPAWRHWSTTDPGAGRRAAP